MSPDTTNSRPGAGMVLARGRFDETKIEALMREHGAHVETYNGKRMIVADPKAPEADANAGDPDLNPTPHPKPHPHTTSLSLSFMEPVLAAIATPRLSKPAIDPPTPA